MATKNVYRQYIPDLELSIERDTASVPDDGKFYVLRSGHILKSCKTLKQAQELYKSIIQESGYKPSPPATQEKSPAQEQIERYMEAKEMYWADSHRYRGGGGKGGRGGV